jgi:hypothetical protein
METVHGNCTLAGGGQSNHRVLDVVKGESALPDDKKNYKL